MKSILIFLVASALSGCSGFQPVRLEHDEKEHLDYREGEWQPKNS